MPPSCGGGISSGRNSFHSRPRSGLTYDSGDYHQTLDKALGIVGYDAC